MQAVCILLKIQPTEIYAKENNYKKTYDYWKSAIGPNCLGDTRIIQKLTQVDPTKLDAEVITAVDTLFEKEELTREKIGHANMAALGIYEWVMACRSYFFVYKSSEPIRDKLIKADLQYRDIKRK